MALSSVLDDAWARAQPQLASIRNALGGLAQKDVRVMRVSQLDSELLDQELTQILQEPLNDALGILNPTIKSRYELELKLIIQVILYKFSIWNTGASYGAKLQGLRYVTRQKGNAQSSSGLPRNVLIVHGSLTLLLPYLYNRFRAHALSRAWPDVPSTDIRKKIWNFAASIESVYTSLALANFVAFLCRGDYRTIADRIMQLRLIPARRAVTRDVSYEFMNRQMVWHTFTEFLLFLLPLVNARVMRRWLSRILSIPFRTFYLPFFSSQTESSKNIQRHKEGKFASLPGDQCAICAQDATFNLNMAEGSNTFPATQAVGQSSDGCPINTPYRTSCGHIYCYRCLAERLIRAADESEDEQGWECLRCGTEVTEINRYTVEIFETESSGSEYGFSSDLDLGTDVSGSLGSYSESMLSE